MPLADTQSAFRDVIVADAPPADVLAGLADVGDKAYRLSIHQRHYDASLVTVLRGRYPTLEWLLGSEFLGAAATLFARQFPPTRPCMAEYGADFPRFLATRSGTERMPWLAELGALERQVGAVSVAIEKPPLALDALTTFADIDPERISVTLQPGLAYVSAAWPVDELITLRLSGNAPEQLTFDRAPVLLEVRGARGAFRIQRLAEGAYAFRAALNDGAPLGVALEAAANRDPSFDPGAALAALFAENLVTTLDAPDEDSP